MKNFAIILTLVSLNSFADEYCDQVEYPIAGIKAIHKEVKAISEYAVIDKMQPIESLLKSHSCEMVVQKEIKVPAGEDIIFINNLRFGLAPKAKDRVIRSGRSFKIGWVNTFGVSFNENGKVWWVDNSTSPYLYHGKNYG